MDATRPVVPEGRQLVQSWRPGGFIVSGRAYTGSVIILADRTLAWLVTEPAAATAETLAALDRADPAPDLLVFGAGARLVLPDAALRATLRQRGIVIEPMATPAACRTFNVLVAEGRRVAAALIAMPPL